MSKSKLNIHIAEEFSDAPGARYYEDGDNSGQEFREKFLEKNFNNYEIIIINLDDTEGYATSFLEEAFGGLARKFNKTEVLKKLEFISEDEPDLIEEIKEYINNAKRSEL